MSARVVILLGVMALHASALAAEGTGGFVTTHGKDDPVCREANDFLERISPREFREGRWRETFGMRHWTSSSWQVETASGTRESVPFKYGSVDLDGDGSEEVAVVTTGMIRSVFFDWLYLVDELSFRSAQEDGQMQFALEQSRKLNPSNIVVFSDGASAIPVELELWERADGTYLLLKEYNFARARDHDVNAFVVAELTSAAVSGDERRLRPQLVCRFVQE